jgi:hypothetical protein
MGHKVRQHTSQYKERVIHTHFLHVCVGNVVLTCGSTLDQTCIRSRCPHTVLDCDITERGASPTGFARSRHGDGWCQIASPGKVRCRSFLCTNRRDADSIDPRIALIQYIYLHGLLHTSLLHSHTLGCECQPGHGAIFHLTLQYKIVVYNGLSGGCFDAFSERLLVRTEAMSAENVPENNVKQ